MKSSAARKVPVADSASQDAAKAHPYTAAREALERANGDVAKGIKNLIAEARRDSALRDAMSEPWMGRIAEELVGAVVRTQRSVIWNKQGPAGNSALSQAQRIELLAEGNFENLLNFTLPGGKPLSAARKGEIEEAARFYAAQSRDMGHKSRWLALVSSALPDDLKPAGMVFDGKKLRELQIRAERNDE